MIKINVNGGITFWSIPSLAIGGSFHSRSVVPASTERRRMVVSFLAGVVIGIVLFF
jgi:hypothetical protein